MQRAWRVFPVGVVAAWALVAAGCSNSERPDAQGQITMQGTVHQTTESDGTPCWQFTSAKGNNYELQPAQVPHDLLVDGEHATIVVKTRSGFSYCKVGTLVDVVSASPQRGA